MNNIFVKPKVGDRIRIGYIEDNTLKLLDKDNYHRDSKSLGLDKEILFNLDLHYEFITATFHKHNLITTRSYFSDHAVEHNILNFRDMVFLPLEEFGLTKALKYEREIEDQALTSKDVFDILKEDNPRVLNEWLKAVEREEAIKSRAPKEQKVRIEL